MRTESVTGKGDLRVIVNCLAGELAVGGGASDTTKPLHKSTPRGQANGRATGLEGESRGSTQQDSTLAVYVLCAPDQ
jgi:hypothetical protein